MADEKVNPKGFINKLRSVFNLSQVDSTTYHDAKAEEAGYRSLSTDELASTFRNIYVPDTYKHQGGKLDKMMIPSMIEPLGRELISRKSETAKLIKMSVESRQAAGIMIPSILTPNDFSKNVFQVIVDDETIDDGVKAAIVELITEHFGDILGWKYKLSGWVDDAMYKEGCKAIMIFPSNIIGEMKSRIAQLSTSTEALSGFIYQFNQELSGSIESLSVGSDPVKIKKRVANIRSDRQLLDGLVGSLEQYPSEDISDDTKRLTRAKRLRTQLAGGLESGVKLLETAEYSLVSFTSDPRIIFSSKIENAVALESIDSTIMDKLKPNPKKRKLNHGKGIADGTSNAANIQIGVTPYIDLSDYIVDDKAEDFPAVMELPCEAVIPITVEGSPDNHLGYFILLNENGTPISVDTDNWEDLVDTTSGNHRVDNLFSAFYGSTNFSITQKLSHDAKADILNQIYDTYLTRMLTDRLDNYGFTGYEIRMASDVSRVMLGRLMKYTETRVLFAPKKLVHYLAFEYHNDGTGKSKIEDIKFPLSLKIMFIVVRLMALIESSINRRQIRIGLDDTVGNPLEILRSVKKKVLEGRRYGLSYDPTTIISSVLDKSITMVPTRIPGVEELTIENEEKNVAYPRPDDGILEEVDNMHMMGFGVPPSAMNRLNEDEFSRSVASNNIFFGNQLRGYQVIICKFMTDMLQSYIGFSDKLKEAISGLVKEKLVAPEGASPTDGENPISETGGEIDEDKVSSKLRDDESTELLVEMIVSSINFTLASPDLAHDKSSFEEIREYVEIIDQILSAIYPNELTSDSELAETIGTLRAHTKSKLLLDHIRSNSIMSGIEFDTMDDIQISTMANLTQKLLNLKQALASQLNSMKPPEGGSTSEDGEDESGSSPW